MRERNCANCKYGQWDYQKNHIVETLDNCNECKAFDKWKQVNREED